MPSFLDRDPGSKTQMDCGKLELIDTVSPGVQGSKSDGRPSPRYETWRWTPPDSWLLPKDYPLQLSCFVTTDGIREFLPFGRFPAAGNDGFIFRAFAGGLTLLIKRGEIDAISEHSYSVMWHAFGFVRQRRQHIHREFKTFRDLREEWAKLSGNSPYPKQGRRALIPPEFVDPEIASDNQMTLKEIRQFGLEAANRAGIKNLSIEQVLQCAYWEISRKAEERQDPLKLPHDPSQIVREAIFDIDMDPDMLRNCLDSETMQRFAKAVRKNKRRGEDFFRKLLGPHSSLTRQIAKQKKGAGSIDLSIASQELCCIGWRAYEYVAQCVHALMSELKQLIAPPLDVRETHFFDHVFLMQPYLGGLPFVLIAERMSFLMPLLYVDFWGQPGNSNGGRVVQRALYLYGRMARRRREVDRNKKNRKKYPAGHSKVRSANPHTPRAWISKEAVLERTPSKGLAGTATGPQEVLTQLRELADMVRQDERLSCQSCGSDELVPGNPTPFDDDSIQFIFRCKKCGRKITIERSTATMRNRYSQQD